MRAAIRKVFGTGGARPGEGVRWRQGRGLLAPGDDGAGRALVAVIAVLAFLAVGAAGAAVGVASVADGWRSSVSGEATIVIRPSPGRDADADVTQALALARAGPGVLGASALSRAESERLLEPWLGQGLDLSGLPVPRLVVLKLGREGGDLPALRRALRDALPTASVDDGAGWIGRLSVAAGTVVAGALGLVALVLVAAGLAVAFATRGVMAGNREVVDVLHLMGASDGFIASQFIRRFASLGLKGGLLGGAAACGAAALCHWLVAPALSGPSLGGPEPGSALHWGGALAAAVAIVPTIAGIAALASWAAVKRFLHGGR